MALGIEKLTAIIHNTMEGSVQGNKTPRILWFLPVVHLLVALMVQRQFGYFFLWVTDPEYFHLMNGIALGHLHLDAAYIDHPGTPIQVAVALSSWIYYLISGSDNMYLDIAQNPEQYIFAANLLFNTVLMFAIFWLGKKTARLTGNLHAALLLQLGFFTHISMIKVTGRLLPEGFLFLPLIALMVLMLHYLYKGIPKDKENSRLILFSIVMGWGLATKLTFAPFIIIPLMLLPGTKNKLYCIGLTAAAFLLLAFPVLSHMNYFLRWTTNMFTHTGNWGNGNSGFMDLSLVPRRLQQLFRYSPQLFVLTVLLLVETLWIKAAKPHSVFLNRYLNIASGTLFSLFLLVLFICKHFALHYMIPLVLMDTFIMLLILIPFVYNKKTKHLYFVGMFVAILFSINAFAHFSKEPFPPLREQEKKVCAFREKVDNDGLLIISGHWAGTPFKAFSLANGMLLTGPAMKEYKQSMRTIYPHTYCYYDWTDKFFYWGDYVASPFLVQQQRPIYIFTGKEKEKDLQKIVARFKGENPQYQVSIDTLINSEQYPEKLYKMTCIQKPRK